MFMNYRELFYEISTDLAYFINGEIPSEIVAEQYNKKFITYIMNNKKIKIPNKYPGMYRSLFDVMYDEDNSYKLSTSKYPKLALNYIVGELYKHLGLSYKEFLKLTLEETDILLDIVSLKQNVTDAANEEIKKDLDNKKDDDIFSFKGL